MKERPREKKRVIESVCVCGGGGGREREREKTKKKRQTYPEKRWAMHVSFLQIIMLKL